MAQPNKYNKKYFCFIYVFHKQGLSYIIRDNEQIHVKTNMFHSKGL